MYDVRRAIETVRIAAGPRQYVRSGCKATARWPASRSMPRCLSRHSSSPRSSGWTCMTCPSRIATAPIFLNVSRYLDMPQAVALAAERSKIVIYQDEERLGLSAIRRRKARLGCEADSNPEKAGEVEVRGQKSADALL